MTGARAQFAEVDEMMVRSVTYKTAIESETNLKSATYYDITQGKGKERALITYNYYLNTGDVKNSTVYIYETGDYETARMTESQTRLGTVSFTDPFSVSNELQSTTYYYLGTREKGDEVADYTHDYKTGKDSYYFYGTAGDAGTIGLRAQNAEVDEMMVRSVTYKSALESETNLKSATYYDVTQGKGKERALIT